VLWRFRRKRIKKKKKLNIAGLARICHWLPIEKLITMALGRRTMIDKSAKEKKIIM
jgi:hypothetical protein